MTGTQSRLERRIQRDFTKPGSADGVLRLLADLPRRAGYDDEMFASERFQAAIVLLIGSDLARLRQMLDLAASDWRDLLIAAGLADEDWPERLDSELGEHPQMSTRTFDTLGFSPTYSCQPDPELPGDGDWGCPVHGFQRDGGLTIGQFRSRWGTALIARFTPADATTWVGLFEAGGLGGIDGVFACPDPSAALAVCDGQGYLVDVAAPERTTTIHFAPITQAKRTGAASIVLASFSNLTALGSLGQAWMSERLCLDNLKIVSTNADTIECTGDFLDGGERFTVDARTGELQEGRRLLDTWPGR